MKALIALLTVLFLATGAIGKEAAPLADDEAVEKRLVNIAEDLRCLVCQNESLAASRADLAQDLRREIREQIGRASPTRRSSISWSAATATSCDTGHR